MAIIPSIKQIFNYHYNEVNSCVTPNEYFQRVFTLIELIKRNGITSIFDVGCRNRDWTRNVDFAGNGIHYSGGDISESMVSYCRETFPSITILQFDCTTDPLPASDLIFVSDVLIHLNNSDKLKFLKNFVKSKARYLLVTQQFDVDLNRDNEYQLIDRPPELKYDPDEPYVPSFPWAPVNWYIAPWNFPAARDTLYDGNNPRMLLWHKDDIKQIVENIQL